MDKIGKVVKVQEIIKTEPKPEESLYSKYIRERQGATCIELECGFISYRVESKDNKKLMHIVDIFVDKDFRSGTKHTAVPLLRSIIKKAKKYKCDAITSTIYVNTVNATDSLKANLYYGFKVVSANNNIIFLMREIDAPFREE